MQCKVGKEEPHKTGQINNILCRKPTILVVIVLKLRSGTCLGSLCSKCTKNGEWKVESGEWRVMRNGGIINDRASFVRHLDPALPYVLRTGTETNDDERRATSERRKTRDKAEDKGINKAAAPAYRVDRGKGRGKWKWKNTNSLVEWFETIL